MEFSARLLFTPLASAFLALGHLDEALGRKNARQ
jgi:hypothetical protein